MRIDDLDIGFRPAKDADFAFVIDSWIESYRLAHAAGPIPMDMYRKVMKEIVVDRILQRSGCAVLVAYNKLIPDQVMGWVCCEVGELGPIIWYVDVKHFIRKQGLATALLARCGIDPHKPYLYLFKTKIVTELQRAWPGGKWDTIALRKVLSLEPSIT